MSIIASHSPLNISETVRDRTLRTTYRRCLWGVKWPRDQWRHVTPKGQTRDLNTLRAQYLENSWRCYLATIALSALRQYGRLS